MKRLIVVLWLTALWVILWRDLSVANVLSGVAVSLVLVAVVSLDWAGGKPGLHRIRPIRLLVFLAYFAWKLLEANVLLAREVVTPRNRIQTGIIAVPLHGVSEQVLVLVANAVSLTPGTLTLEVDRGEQSTLYVHVLHLRDPEDARDEVRKLAAMARAAVDANWQPTDGRRERTS